MSTAIRAIYEDGVLKPKEKLALDDHAEVIILILPVEKHPDQQPDADRVAALRQQVDTWLVQQPADAVRGPLPAPIHVEQDFEHALAAIRERAGKYSLAQIQADVETAIAEARELSLEERQQLDVELEQLLAQWLLDDLA